MKKQVSQLNVAGKKVLVRVDFNVPHKGEVISDDNRIAAAVPTIVELLNKGAKVVLMSHLGKIKWGKVDDAEIEKEKRANDLKIAIEPLKKHLKNALGKDVSVSFSEETRGESLKAKVDALKDGEVLLVQNTRYEKGETKNNPELSAEWASLVDAYVMDAFGSAHRAHASTVGVPTLLKEQGKETAVGFLVEKEIKALSNCVDCKEENRPYIAILGGAKVSDKIQVIDSLLKKCDKILIGGGMSYTFKYALGNKVGKSICEKDQAEYAKKCYETGKIVLPVDTVIADGTFDDPTNIHQIETPIGGNKGIPDDFEGLDIGEKTAELYCKEIENAKTIFWNGPMGVFEKEQFQAGTIAVCKACVEATKKGAFSVIGGGDSAAAAKQFGYSKEFSHVSTGGGASLELIQFDGHLPGIDDIEDC
ncbi:MAG: phosphoglycerate kinase [Candidatus Enterosoma sp.]|nr:phosphoglycerate kinase [Candidatus Enterosoma sp.]